MIGGKVRAFPSEEYTLKVGVHYLIFQEKGELLGSRALPSFTNWVWRVKILPGVGRLEVGSGLDLTLDGRAVEKRALSSYFEE